MTGKRDETVVYVRPPEATEPLPELHVARRAAADTPCTNGGQLNNRLQPTAVVAIMQRRG